MSSLLTAGQRTSPPTSHEKYYVFPSDCSSESFSFHIPWGGTDVFPSDCVTEIFPPPTSPTSHEGISVTQSEGKTSVPLCVCVCVGGCVGVGVCVCVCVSVYVCVC